MVLARTLVRGCDVWLNTPRRPLEASGTSGMKAAVNGVLNLSVLDGWWAEGYSPELGWAIDGASDDADREQLYRLLEEQVVPTCTDDRDELDRDDEGVDRAAGAALLDAPRRDRVRRALLPAGARSTRARSRSFLTGSLPRLGWVFRAEYISSVRRSSRRTTRRGTTHEAQSTFRSAGRRGDPARRSARRPGVAVRQGQRRSLVSDR